MASSPTDFDEDAARRDYRAPYSHDRPIPTIQRYRERRHELEDRENTVEEAQHTEEDGSRVKRAFNSVKAIANDEDKQHPSGDPYSTANRNVQEAEGDHSRQGEDIALVPSEGQPDKQDGKHGSDGSNESRREISATEKAFRRTDARQKRKDMKHNKRDDGGREVTDPVTHLPLIVRDSTDKDLRRAPENEHAPGIHKKTATGLSGASKSSSQLNLEKGEIQDNFDGMQKVFPPPSFSDTNAELARTYQCALATGLGIIILLASSVILTILHLTSESSHDSPHGYSSFGWSERQEAKPRRVFVPLAISIIFASVAAFATIFGIQSWLGSKVKEIWEDEVWDSARSDEFRLNNTQGRLPESVAWMNSLLAGVWPLINPDLFASVVDMLEDVMQASLPKVIRMVSIDDIGQGSEAIRILGIRWLPTGAASQSVDEDGKLKQASNHETNGSTDLGERKEQDAGDESNSSNDKNQAGQQRNQKQAQQTTREGMEAEQGDFINMELAFAYRARSSGKSLRSKVKNAHLYLKFYLPGGIFVPVWVELRGMIGTVRIRMQLTPDPPFFSLCTLTFLGQPRANLSCVPLSKHLPNLMNVPLISSFVQSSIDAALAEYVAPRSLTLDLKDMLVGDDFKKDTVNRGVIVVFVKEARGFKEGDGGIGPLKGSSDSYITCSWGKFGKTMSSTRIIEQDQSPRWDEWAYLLVSPQEIDAEEKLRLQLWDSDKITADDDLGRVEVDLKELMHSTETRNSFCEREDRFKGQDPDENMPGSLTWTVGYFSKIGITSEQLSTQKVDKGIKTTEDLKKDISEVAERKLREATAHDVSKETNQQKSQDYKEREDSMICASRPDASHPSGILSVQIHNITGLEVESLQKQDRNGIDDKESEDEESDDLPSSYCTIILNHKKIYMTRTKPKNAKPFFNAGTERFIRDWRNAEVMISVRDSRERENDALLGIVYLPLEKVLYERSQLMDVYPLVGGVGFGRARISMVFRSVELQMPKELLGWDVGTLEIKSPVKPFGLPQDISSHRIKLRSTIAKVKMTSESGQWFHKGERKSEFIAYTKRYASALVVEFCKSRVGTDSTAAFAIFWLKDLADDEQKTVNVKVWKGGKENFKRATACVDYGGLDGEKSLGEIQLTMRFWPGLSGYHKRHAQNRKNSDMRNVMEVLDTVNDEIEDRSEGVSAPDSSDTENDLRGTTKKLKPHTNQDSSGGESDRGSGIINKVKARASDLLRDNDSDDGERGARAQLKDYKAHHKQLHRRHRGIMQWKVARTADWARDKARHGKSKVAGVLEHSEKQTAVETEV
ncbi:hypothetical protein PZA11_006061 [Diplocarpon coronariae]|uniref:Meiotically up-regulated protein n=1 Tax=Diplocarpon coronariae TaxID=2795749 RepID=A0A218YSW1_9HELO|nr:hypothetical protein B2J93_8178 [Marssonina coronariae]